MLDLNHAIAAKPWRGVKPEREALLYINRGIVFSATGKPDEAISDFNKAIELYAANADAYSGRGHAYLKKTRFKEAATDFLKSLELEPNSDLTAVLPDFQSHLATETSAETKAEIEKLLAKIQGK